MYDLLQQLDMVMSEALPSSQEITLTGSLADFLTDWLTLILWMLRCLSPRLPY